MPMKNPALVFDGMWMSRYTDVSSEPVRRVSFMCANASSSWTTGTIAKL